MRDRTRLRRGGAADRRGSRRRPRCKRWRSGWYNDRFIEGEEDEPEHRLALGAELDLERLAELAIAIWQPLLAREVVEG